MAINDDNAIAVGGQLQLLPETVTDDMLSAAEIKQGVCTGSKLKHYDPDKYAEVCYLLADGSLSQRQISRLTGISRNLIAGIVKTQVADIEPLKQRLAGGSRNLAQLCIERATELVLDDGAKISLKDLMIGAGVMIDKSQVLSGQATSIIEFRPHDPGTDEFEAAMRAAQAEGSVQDADYSMIDDETGIEAEEVPTKGSEPGDDGADPAADGGEPGVDRDGGELPASGDEEVRRD